MSFLGYKSEYSRYSITNKKSIRFKYSICKISVKDNQLVQSGGRTTYQYLANLKMYVTCDLVILVLSICHKEIPVYEHKNFQNSVHSSIVSNSKSGNNIHVHQQENASIIIASCNGILYPVLWTGATERKATCRRIDSVPASSVMVKNLLNNGPSACRYIPILQVGKHAQKDVQPGPQEHAASRERVGREAGASVVCDVFLSSGHTRDCYAAPCTFFN